MKTNGKVTFTPQQIDLLVKSFPQAHITPKSTLEEIMFQAGQQNVVNFISRLSQEEYVRVLS